LYAIITLIFQLNLKKRVQEVVMPDLKYGFVLPFGDARMVSDLAQEAEQAGWDGVFRPEPVWHIDAWICLTAAAMTTERIRLGTLISPLPRMRPWRVAAQTATLDNLSGGRVILGVGLGWLLYGYQAFPDEVTNTRQRAEMLDEFIEVLDLLYRGAPAKFEGKHYRVNLTALHEQYYPPKPVQQPRIPIWAAGMWGKEKSMRRVLKCDGLIPEKASTEGQPGEISPEDIRAMRAYVQANRKLDTPFDIIMQGKTVDCSRVQIQEKIGPYIEAGATWWIEELYGIPEEKVIERLKQGPER
jgi:alkanesulfonate monooxygenase SsuD/methylene tetrahydromethanopterin reductase-like flavin-dependent oxidoreductase (luciferase family)